MLSWRVLFFFFFIILGPWGILKAHVVERGGPEGELQSWVLLFLLLLYYLNQGDACSLFFIIVLYDFRSRRKVCGMCFPLCLFILFGGKLVTRLVFFVGLLC